VRFLFDSTVRFGLAAAIGAARRTRSKAGDRRREGWRHAYPFDIEQKEDSMKAAVVGALMALVAGPAVAQTAPPKPILYLTSTEPYAANGKNWIRYKYDVFNKASYPAAMFAPAPGLPPCGANTNASRTWVDFFDQRGARLYGFCALGSPDNLGSIWFSMEEGTVPPSWVYVEIIDRQTNTRYRSNLAETSI
jgi:hypothetical protein